MSKKTAADEVDLGWSDALTELSSSDDASDAPADHVATSRAKRATKREALKEDYTIKPAFRPPRTTNYSVQSLYDMLNDERIDVDPDYQRDVVWNDNKQSLLIDSIFRHFYIPPLIFAVSFAEDGTESRVCIDGKQRLTSIRRFIDADISFKDSYTDERMWTKRPKDRQSAVKILPENVCQSFMMKQIVCVEYDALTEDQEREIFQRVQLGMALTPAERMQAINGPHATLARDLLALINADGSGFTEWNQERGRGFQAMAAVLELAERYPKMGPAWPSPATLEKLLGRTTQVAHGVRRGMKEAARALVILSHDKVGRKALCEPARMSPVEFVAVLVLLYAHRTALGVRRAAEEITKMRTAMRNKFKSDLKCNTPAYKLAHKCITQVDVFAGDEETLSRIVARVERAEKEHQQGAPSVASTSSGQASTLIDEGMAKLHVSSGQKSTRKSRVANKPSEHMDVDSDPEDHPRRKPIPKARRSGPPPRTTKRKRTVSSDEESEADSEDNGAPQKRRLVPHSSAALEMGKPKKKALKPAPCAATDFKTPPTPKEAAARRKATAFGLKTSMPVPEVPKKAPTAETGLSKSTAKKLPAFTKKAAPPVQEENRSASSTKRALPPRETSSVSSASSATSTSSMEMPLVQQVRERLGVPPITAGQPPTPMQKTLDPRTRPPPTAPSMTASSSSPPAQSIIPLPTAPSLPLSSRPPPPSLNTRIPPSSARPASAYTPASTNQRAHPPWLANVLQDANIPPARPAGAPLPDGPPSPPTRVRRVSGPQTSSRH